MGSDSTTRRRARADTGYSTGLTKDVQDRIVARIRSGVWWVTEAVAAEGYTREAHYHWMRQGARGIEPYASYAAAIEQAKAQLEADLLKKMGDLSECGDAKVELTATQWRLQNLNPARYGRKLEITAPSAPTREAYEAMTDEELEAEARKALGEGGAYADHDT
jgi:hypothetical protein